MRQFICPSSPDAAGHVRLSASDSRYLLKVLRLSDGDTLDARLPDGRLVSMVLKLSGTAAFLQVTESAVQAASVQGVHAAELGGGSERVRLWLFQFLPKPQKMDTIVRQATECGVEVIVPIAGDFSVKNDAGARIDRWERIVREARQQSGSPVPTRIMPVLSVTQAAEVWKQEAHEGAAFVLHESPAYTSACLRKAAAAGIRKAAVAVGCEGGMSDRELEVLQEAGFEPLHFTTNVLRAETAALYGLAAIQQFLVGGVEDETDEN